MSTSIYNYDRLLALADRSELDAREYFKDLPQYRQSNFIQVVQEVLQTITDAPDAEDVSTPNGYTKRICKLLLRVMTDA